MALFCAAIERDSVSLLRFLILNHDSYTSCVVCYYYYCFTPSEFLTSSLAEDFTGV